MAMFGGGMDKLLGPMIEKFKRDMDKAHEELKATVLEASAGGGMVTAKANGEGDLLEVKIAPEALEDAEMLQDMIVAAVCEVQDKAKGLKGEKLGGMMGGMNALGIDVGNLF
jgi:nucleoid-associated protein EbfC